MLTLKDVTKNYGEGENEVQALKGITISFRKCEFVSILGQSGCGKSTLLNIIGGLDRATGGEIILNGVSAEGFNDNDWDDYRNSKIGFVFQSYNLIPHLSVQSNVELALTISGISGAERAERAKKALERVGLEHKRNKRPCELSGGQMQRVAIARAIVNEPDILLADEPTGAIDSETSIQIMEILKEISKTKLVVMVTHNDVLAEEYSTRIVRFLDGRIVGDTDPYTEDITFNEEDKQKNEKKTSGRRKKTASKKHKKGSTMSFPTAVVLSAKNLVNKKGRSILTAVAGSIGIISIALILALNNGFTGYIGDFERQSMSKYPIAVSTGENSVVSVFEDFLGGDALDGDSLNINSMLDVFTGDDTDKQKFTEEELIYIYGKFTGLFSAMSEKLTKTTDISKFKRYTEEKFDYSLANVKYDYSVNMTLFCKKTKTDSATQEETTVYNLMNPLSESSAMAPLLNMLVGSTKDEEKIAAVKTALDTFAFWDEIIADENTVLAQYDVLEGNLPKNMNEVVIVLDEYNQISDFDAFALNEMDLGSLILALTVPSTLEQLTQSFDDVIGKEYYVLPTSADYVKNEVTGLYESLREEGGERLKSAIEEKGIPVRICGILRPKEGIKGGCINGVVGYTSELGNFVTQDANESEITLFLKNMHDNYEQTMAQVKEIFAKKDADENYVYAPADMAVLAKASEGMKNPFSGEKMTEDEYKNILKDINARDKDNPSYIYFYPNRIADKGAIVSFIEGFNAAQSAEEKTAEEEGEKADTTYVIEYKDNLDSVVNELNSVVDTITYILVAVACVSVVVTMFLIAIIMYISVQDRTREIGIMRAIGARKRDISNIFNVETMLLGFAAGIIGTGIAFALQFPANLILSKVMNMSGLISMAWWHPVALITGAVIITVASGLIPAAIAARKEPVVALRTE